MAEPAMAIASFRGLSTSHSPTVLRKPNTWGKSTDAMWGSFTAVKGRYYQNSVLSGHSLSYFSVEVPSVTPEGIMCEHPEPECSRSGWELAPLLFSGIGRRSF